MSSHTRVATGWLALAAMTSLTIGCGAPMQPVVYPTAPPIYYGVSFETERATVGGVLPRTSDVLAKDAKELLKPGRTVAFLPPDSCLPTSVAPSGATQGPSTIVMMCGALLASLEAEVAKAGYSVVSWQAIKAGGPVASQERAKSLGVNVLFEVNELFPSEREAGALQVSKLQFSREDGPGQSTPVMAPSRATAEQCAKQITGLGPKGEVEHLSTVNLKAVDVTSGRALWLYQNTVVELAAKNEHSKRTLYFRADGTRPEPPLPTQRNKPVGVAGAFGLLLGMTTILGASIHAALTSDDRRKEGTDISLTPFALAGLMVVGGSVMMGYGFGQVEPDRTVPPATYPDREAVLCRSQPIYDPWSSQPAVSRQAPAQQQDTYTFVEAAKPGRDQSRERTARLNAMTTADFVAALLAVAR